MSEVELRGWLRGVGLWTPEYDSFEAYLAAGAPADLASTKRCQAPAELLHPRLRRRTSTLTRAAVTCTQAALGDVAIDQVRLVLVSTFGEIETTVDLLEQLADPTGPVSPTKFHNSVHNTATGYLSIAGGNARESTTLTGGVHNLEAGLLEALAGLADPDDDSDDVVLLLAEELLPAPFERPDAEPTFAVALHLSRRGPGVELRLRSEAMTDDGPPAPGVGGQGLPLMAPAVLELLRAVASARSGAQPMAVPLVRGRDEGLARRWLVDLRWCP